MAIRRGHARARWGQAMVKALFVRTVRQCVETGLVDGTLLHRDASLTNAAIKRQPHGRTIAQLERPTASRPFPALLRCQRAALVPAACRNGRSRLLPARSKINNLRLVVLQAARIPFAGSRA